MLRLSSRSFFFGSLYRISKPPVSGYEISELPSEKVFFQYIQHFKRSGVLLVLHNNSVTSRSPESTAKLSAAPPSTQRSTDTSSSTHPSHPSSSVVSQDHVLRTFISSMNTVNLGNPREIKIALVPGAHAPNIVQQFQVLTYPTTLLFLDGQYVSRCVGARTRELSIKSLLMLRNAGRNIFSRE